MTDAPAQGAGSAVSLLVMSKQGAGNQTKAAQVLGVSRRTLVTRLKEYSLPRPRKPV